MQVHREWSETEAKVRKMPGHSDIRNTSEWLVEMTGICDSGITIIEIVHGANDWEASFEAFITRNMPDNWIVTQVERAE